MLTCFILFFLEIELKNLITDIHKLSSGQNSNDLWFDCRYGVITASVTHDVLLKCSRLRTSVKSSVAKILQYSKSFRVESLAWGVEN